MSQPPTDPSIELLQQQQALQSQALRYIIEGRWDAGSHGAQSAEAILAALNPAWQGRIAAVPFDRPSP